MTDLSCAKTVLNPYTKRSEETTRVLPFGYHSPNSIYSAVFVMSLQNSNERRDMYVLLHNSKVKDTVAKREPETFRFASRRNTKGDFNECWTEFHKTRQEMHSLNNEQVAGQSVRRNPCRKDRFLRHLNLETDVDFRISAETSRPGCKRLVMSHRVETFRQHF